MSVVFSRLWYLKCIMALNIPFTKRFREQTMMLEENVLKEANSNYQALTIKSRHLLTQNQSLHSTVHDLESQISSLRAINQQLTRNSPKSVQILIDQLNRQNTQLQNSLFRLIKSNQQLSCDILMKNQLIAQNQHEFNQILASYENKIYDLRIGLQSKEACFSNMEDKIKKGLGDEEYYQIPTRANVMYFSEMNQTKLLLERYQAENAEIQLTLFKQHQLLEQTTKRLTKCQSALKSTSEWQNYKNTLETLGVQDKVKTESNLSKMKVSQELSKYQQKYKNVFFPWRYNRKSDLSVQIYELRLLVTKLYRQSWQLQEDKRKLVIKIVAKEEEIRKLKESFQKVEEEVRMAKVEVEFYREHFKQLTKVPLERKIKFYQENYPFKLPSLEEKINNKASQSKFWKLWQQKMQDRWPLIEKRMFYRFSKLSKPLVRSNSCMASLCYLQPLREKPVAAPLKDLTIASFLNDYNETNTYLGYTFAEAPIRDKEPDFFQQEQISIIEKPSKSKEKTSPFSKKQQTIEEV